MKELSFTERKNAYQKVAQETVPVLQGMPYQAPQLIKGSNTYTQLVNELVSKGIKKPIIITDHAIYNLGLVNELIQEMNNKELDFVIFKDIESDPSFETTLKGKEACLNHNYDSVIAIGGGSVMDAAKVINASASQDVNPKSFDGLFKVQKRGKLMACIPTTAGTGSEVTIFAVITDKQENRKAAVVDTEIVPEYAVLDPKLIVGLPASISAATGADALTHAFESFVSIASTPETEKYALDAIQLGFEALPQTVKTPDNLFYREQMLKASYYAGLSFTKAGLGWVHGIAHQLGALYHIPHGVAIGMTLPHVVKFYIDVIPEKIGRLGQLIGVASENDSSIDAANKFHKALSEMLFNVGVPQKAKELQGKDITEIGNRAISEIYATATPVPKYFDSQEEIENLIKELL